VDFDVFAVWVGRLAIVIVVIAGLRAIFGSIGRRSNHAPEMLWDRLKREYELDDVSLHHPVLGVNRGQRFFVVSDGTAIRKIPFDSLLAVEIRQNGQLVVCTNRNAPHDESNTRAIAFGAKGFVRAGTHTNSPSDEVNRLDLLIYSDSLDWGVEVNLWERFDEDDAIALELAVELPSKVASLKEWYSKIATVIQSPTSSETSVGQAVAA
jgi:hypothetical protein